MAHYSSRRVFSDELQMLSARWYEMQLETDFIEKENTASRIISSGQGRVRVYKG